ncbi:MAG TPA: serine hydrolase [Chthoniobacteraceae bacterium]|nr:serine hydrolase [Chthoniobacteraceae bacterium]
MGDSQAERLRARIREIQREFRLEAIGVAVHDYERGRHFQHEADRWFHAASTFKAAVLLAVFNAAEKGLLRLDDQLHVRNRFRSIVDGSIYRIAGDRDGDPGGHGRVGRSMKIAELAHAMVTRSSNLATNLLVDFIGVNAIREMLANAGVDGMRIVRGVEDHVAFQKGMNNETTARGLVQLFRLLCEGEFLTEFSRQQIRDIFLAQEFKSMLPARLPAHVRVAHKTGEISTHWHDAGIVNFPDRKPYVVAILTQGPPSVDQPQRAVAALSEALFETVTAA